MKTEAEKAFIVSQALHDERGLLREQGNVRAANVINDFLQNAPDESKARMYDILTNQHLQELLGV